MTGPNTGVDASIIPAADYLQKHAPFIPQIGVILGSGLGPISDRVAADVTFPYSEIPGFPVCSVEGHAGRLIFGMWERIPVAVLQGRAHRYEGHSLDVITRPIRTLKALGISILVTTCAAGALNDAAPGALFLIEDHLNLMGDSPLLMRDIRAGASRFVEMADAYDVALRDAAGTAARQAGVHLERGVIAGVPGPAYETGAEAEMLRRLGAHAVNMSVVPEVIAARSVELRVLALAVLTNRSGVSMRTMEGHAGVLKNAESSSKALAIVLEGVLRQLPS